MVNSAAVRLPVAVVFIKAVETLTSDETETPEGALLMKFEAFVTSVELVAAPVKEYSEI